MPRLVTPLPMTVAKKIGSKAIMRIKPKCAARMRRVRGITISRRLRMKSLNSGNSAI